MSVVLESSYKPLCGEDWRTGGLGRTLSLSGEKEKMTLVKGTVQLGQKM
jgi:hypothetical protein